jgi:hypothetical protein
MSAALSGTLFDMFRAALLIVAGPLVLCQFRIPLGILG